MGANTITQFFTNRPIKNGSAVFAPPHQGSGIYSQDDNAYVVTSGAINASAQYGPNHPRYYTGDSAS